MFALVGWLFADMFLAMTMIFIGASVGTYVPNDTHAVKRTPSPVPQLIGMDKVPVSVQFSVDMNGLLNNDPTVTTQVQSQVHNQLQSYMSTHVNGKAALVSTFGGGKDDATDTNEAMHINTILQNMGNQQQYIFDRNDIVYNHYIDRGANYGDITIEIYFFLYTT